jgi:hypothetical protein
MMARDEKRSGAQEDEQQQDEQQQDEQQQDEQEQDEQQPDQEQDEQEQDEEQPDEQEQDEQEQSEDGASAKAARPSISAREMTQAAIEALEDLTGYTPEAATGLMWDGESWLVTVDVLELSRIPDTTDLLATYVVQLDGDGNLSGYKRTKRFQRSQADEGG